MGTGRPDRGNLDAELSSFVGRRDALARARELLSHSRLLTLVGPGGVGKTRLALRLAADVRRAFDDGAWNVDLSALRDPGQLANLMLGELGVRDQRAHDPAEQLADHLRERHTLVLLDNCEHVVEAVAGLAGRLLRDAPGLRVLATSREALDLDGEQVFVVPPMSLPADERTDLRHLLEHEAIGLLIERARAVRPTFAIDELSAPDAVRLCRLLDGLPLAIELAAARLRSMSLREIADGLDRRFDLLAGHRRASPSRQQTLRALIDSSYELCTGPERQLWASLSVFPGSFDLAAAEAVAGDGGALADAIDRLVAKSLLQADEIGGQMRYRMLMTIAEYGALHLDPDDASRLRRRHFDHYRALALETCATWAGPDQAAALARMRADLANMRAALAWAGRDAEPETAASFAAALRYHWIVGGFLSEGRRQLDAILDTSSEVTRERADALWVAAWVSMLQGDREAAATRLAECSAYADALDDDALAAHVAHWSGLVALFAGDLTAATAHVEHAIRGHEGAGDAAAQLTAQFQLAITLAYDDRLDEAQVLCERTMARCEALGERWARAYLSWASGVMAWRRGRLGEARAAAEAALVLQRDFRDGVCTGLTIELLAWVASARLEHDRTATLLAAADAVWRSIGSTIDAFGPHMAGDAATCVRRAEEALGERRLASLRAARTPASIDAAIEVALATSEEEKQPAAPSLAGLSRRELQVAGLVAEGRTNREIAEALVLSPRTIDNHVARILSKLGFGARAQIGAWIAEQRATIR